MPHILCKIRAPRAAVEHQLKVDAAQHAKDGMHLEHLWNNEEDNGEVVFLFRVDDLQAAKQRIVKTHAKALAANRDAKMYDIYTNMLDTWYDNGGGVFAAFSFVGPYNKWGSWSSMEWINQPIAQAHKYRALHDYLAC